MLAHVIKRSLLGCRNNCYKYNTIIISNLKRDSAYVPWAPFQILHRFRLYASFNHSVSSLSVLLWASSIGEGVSWEVLGFDWFGFCTLWFCWVYELVPCLGCFLLLGNIMLITSVFGKVVPSPEDLIFLSVTSCLSHHNFLNLSKALKVIKGEFREMNKV